MVVSTVKRNPQGGYTSRTRYGALGRPLGLGLNLTRGQRAGFRTAVKAKDLGSWMTQNPTISAMFEQRMLGEGTQGQQNRALRLAQRAGYPLPTVASDPGATPAPPDTGNGNANPTPLSFAEIVDRYMGGSAVNYGPINEYLSKLTGGMPEGAYQLAPDTGNTPSFAEQFQRYQDISGRELEKAVAGMNEMYGSRGARYSTALGQGQEQLRRNALTDLSAQAAEVQRALNQDRATENTQRMAYNQWLSSTRGQSVEQMLAAARDQQAQRDAAAQRAWQAYLMSQGLNAEGLQAALGFASQYPTPGYVVS